MTSIKRAQSVLLAVLLASPVAGFGSTTWTFNYEDNCVSGACDDNYYNGADWSRQYNKSAGDAAGPVTVYGIYNSGKASTTDAVPSSTAGDGTGQLWRGPIDAWDGLGVHTYGEGWDAPQHSVDSLGSIEAVLFDFGMLVDLESVSVGWTQTDSDITVLAYTGAGSPALVNNLSGTTGYTNLDSTYSDLEPDGWEIIGSYADLTTGVARGVNSGNKESRFWMVSAYNSLIDDKGWTENNEYFKLRSVVASKAPPAGAPGVPEPTTWLLMSVGLMGLVSRRHLLQS